MSLSLEIAENAFDQLQENVADLAVRWEETRDILRKTHKVGAAQTGLPLETCLARADSTVLASCLSVVIGSKYLAGNVTPEHFLRITLSVKPDLLPPGDLLVLPIELLQRLARHRHLTCRSRLPHQSEMETSALLGIVRVNDQVFRSWSWFRERLGWSRWQHKLPEGFLPVHEPQEISEAVAVYLRALQDEKFAGKFLRLLRDRARELTNLHYLNLRRLTDISSCEKRPIVQGLNHFA